jgi:hypothetical protein
MRKVLKVRSCQSQPDGGSIAVEDSSEGYVVVDMTMAGEVSSSDVEEIHTMLRMECSQAVNLLIIHSPGTDYSFAAQRNLWNIPWLRRVAFVLTHRSSQSAIECMIAIAANKSAHTRIFNHVDEAKAWLTGSAGSSS